MAKVLIVEDDRRLADTIAELLSSVGHDVKVTYDGPAALLATESCEPDIVFLDLNLPAVSGFRVAKQIRQTCGRAVRLIAYTGWAEFLAKPLSEFGFDAVLVKPAMLEQILGVIDCD
jgi:CheY-like chemotaxis protein